MKGAVLGMRAWHEVRADQTFFKSKGMNVTPLKMKSIQNQFTMNNFRLRELPVSNVFKKIRIKELLAPITSSTPQRTSSLHERTDKEPVVLLAVV